ncbi:uncharacterized protein V1513DRAFT_452798, partial [Lipomyces chichibuensis]|uniref:uncharacterized protein n=1 Tax=Lipomyces chichibuensis TaxID=1546026 RepID=UPI003342E997
MYPGPSANLAGHDKAAYSDSDSEIIRDAAVPSALCAVMARPEKTSLYSNMHAGQEYVDELLHFGNEGRIYRVLRMTLPTFYALRDWSLEHTRLRSSKTQSLPIEEKLVMFLWTMNDGASNRVVQERFFHSGETVSPCFHEVLDALLQLHRETVRLPDESTPL